MKYSYRIFKVLGISIELHITFILFFTLMTGLALLSGANLSLVFFWGSIFIIVLMHELVHSIIAKSFSIPVPKITLTPLGGLANIQMPKNPKQELLISLAGPLFNLVIAFIILIAFFASSVPLLSYDTYLDFLAEGTAVSNPMVLLGAMFWINLILGLFNIVPGFPMDGGRVLRAVLALWMNYMRATEIAVRIGKLISILLIITGFMINPWFVLIGIFLYYAGNSELEMTRVQHALKGKRIGSIAIKEMRHADSNMTVSDFLESVANPSQNYYPVSEEGGRVVGVLDIKSLDSIDRADYALVMIKNLLRTNFEAIDANAIIENVLEQIINKEFMFVVDSGRVIGYLTPKRMFESAQFYNQIEKD